MMLPSLAFALLGPQGFVAAPQNERAETPTARLVGASMFKNGFAITQREIDVAKPGSTLVLPIPSGAMGTLWFTPSDGLELDSVVVENETVSAKSKSAAASMEAVLRLNVGATVTLLIAEREGAPTRLTGKLVVATGEVVVVETPETTRAVPRSAVLSVEGKGLKWESNVESALVRRVMRLRTTGKPGRVRVVALERGLSWIPAYAINLLPDGKTLSLVAKATVVNDLEPLKNLDCRFVTGFPHLPFAETLDPLVEGSPLVPTGGFPSPIVGGGFGSQTPSSFANDRRRGVQVGMNQADMDTLRQTQDGQSLGELFFYPRKGISVGRQGRAAYTLFATKTSYETVYAWDLDDPAPGQAAFTPRIPLPGEPPTDEIWQTLRFVNNTKVPLTTAPATTFEESEIVGQDTLRYASPGQTAELRVTRALDVSTDFTEEEQGRERGFVKGRNERGEYPIYDRVTARGTLTIVNRKATPVKMRIRKSFTGVWDGGDGTPKVTATAAGLRLPNPTGLAEWLVDVAPGATVKLAYRVKLLVGS